MLELPVKTSLAAQYKNIRRTTIKLCEPLAIEDHVVQPVIDVSPPKWNLGHTSWFFETFLLKKFLKGYKEFHEDLSFIFNSYYESVGKRVMRAHRGNLTRPTTEEVIAYRQYIDEHMERLLDNPAMTENQEFSQFFNIGLNHEQQHQELILTDLKYILGHNPLFPAYKRGLRKAQSPHSEIKYLPIEGGIYEIGYSGNGFAWDNEKPVHKVYLAAFRIRNTLVTNREYLEFMEDNGYENYQYWLSEGWDILKENNWQAPLYWHKIDGEWWNYTLYGLEKVSPEDPVTHISFYEADAFASWAGKRLLREEEWEVAARLAKTDTEDRNFLETDLFHPVAPTAGNEDVCHHLFGNAWEWTYSGYFPYPGYKRAEEALGEYNGKFMINQMVLRGGSCATPQDHFRPTYRNFFHPDKKWQFTGIRLAE